MNNKPPSLDKLLTLIQSGNEANITLAFLLAETNDVDLNLSNYDALYSSVSKMFTFEKKEGIKNQLVQLLRLKTLELKQDGLAEFPQFIHLLKSLTELFFAKCKIEALPETIGRLDFSENPLHLDEIEQIKKLLPNCELTYD